MLKRYMLFVMILFDWSFHVMEIFDKTNNSLYKGFSDFLVFVGRGDFTAGYELFWVVFWGMALMLIIMIIWEDRIK